MLWRPAFVALVACTSVLTGACGGSDQASPPATAIHDDAITVASFDFPESATLAELYSQALESHGFTVERAFRLGQREFVAPALEQGIVEVVPEYAGTAARYMSIGTAEPTRDARSTHQELERALAGTDVVALAAAPAENANTFVVTVDTAEKYGLRSLSDLQPIDHLLRFGGPPECPTRPLCLAGLQSVYHLRFAEHIVVDAGGPLTHQALRTGDIDVGLLFTSDPAITENGLVELVDDLGLQPAESVTPLVHASVLDHFGDGVAEALDGVSTQLTTAELRSLNAATAADSADTQAVVAAWLQDHGLS